MTRAKDHKLGVTRQILLNEETDATYLTMSLGGRSYILNRFFSDAIIDHESGGEEWDTFTLEFVED